MTNVYKNENFINAQDDAKCQTWTRYVHAIEENPQLNKDEICKLINVKPGHIDSIRKQFSLNSPYMTNRKAGGKKLTEEEKRTRMIKTETTKLDHFKTKELREKLNSAQTVAEKELIISEIKTTNPTPTPKLKGKNRVLPNKNIAAGGRLIDPVWQTSSDTLHYQTLTPEQKDKVKADIERTKTRNPIIFDSPDDVVNSVLSDYKKS